MSACDMAMLCLLIVCAPVMWPGARLVVIVLCLLVIASGLDRNRGAK